MPTRRQWQRRNSGAAVDLRQAIPDGSPHARRTVLEPARCSPPSCISAVAACLNIRAYTPPALTICQRRPPEHQLVSGPEPGQPGRLHPRNSLRCLPPPWVRIWPDSGHRRNPSTIDESLAVLRAFPADLPQGPWRRRSAASASWKSASLSRLETRLRDPKTRQATLDAIARRVTDAIRVVPPAPPMEVSSPPDVDDNAPPEKNPPSQS